MHRQAGVLVVLVATGAFAQRLHLLETEATAPEPPRLATHASLASPAATPSMGYLPHLGIAAGVGVAMSPLGLWLTSLLSRLTNNLVVSLLPLLVSGLLAPTMTTLAAWLAGNHGRGDGDGRFGFWLPWLLTTGVHVVATVVGAFLGLSLGLPGGLILFSLIDGALMGGTSVGSLRTWARPRPAAPLVTLETHSPTETPCAVLVLSRVEL